MEGTQAGWQVCAPALPTPTQGTVDQRLDGEKRQQPPSRRHKVIRSQPVSSVSKSSKPSDVKQSPANNARERHRVRNLRQAFLSLQAALPSVPPDTKLSKLDVLVLATSYIAHLTHTLDQGRHLPGTCQMGRGPGYLHPMKKWPMRARLYAEALECDLSAGCPSHKN
ncbi:transcription factor 23-like [Pseudophryne corroboree]|uniref:transcription factor 23-like n=1 Tax=Pseudophryne corroboree TaxID=495146 RepID=UPI0030817E45